MRASLASSAMAAVVAPAKSPGKRKKKQAVVEEPPPAPPPAPEVEKEDEGPEPVVDPSKCEVRGLEAHHGITVRMPAEFIVVACDNTGVQRRSGGDAFFIAIRGASRVRARITDLCDGTYSVHWKPVVSGEYSVAVSLFGVSLPGSPFSTRVYDPSPYAPRCEVSGEALNFIAARNSFSFDCRFKDRGGNVAQAVDLDVFVELLPSEPSAAAIYAQAWAAATRLCTEPGDAKARSDPHPTVIEDEGKKEERQGLAGRKKRRNSLTNTPSRAKAGSGAAAPAAAAEATAAVAVAADLTSQMTGDDAHAEGEEEVQTEDDGSDDDAMDAMEDAAQTRQRAIRIKVGRRPLIVRAAPELASPQIALLMPGQTVTVIEERITDGYVRACITFDELMQPASARTERTELSYYGPDEGYYGAGMSSSPGSPLPAASDELMPGTPGSPISPAARMSARPLQVGWVTLKKNGKNLVSSRLKLETSRRQQYVEQWDRRLRNDKLKNDVAGELGIDPTGIGFAYGGVYPGHLHAKGKLHEKHTVSYSIGRVGRYLLHVRLRQQALPVPGSPFALVVRAGVAHHRSTCLPIGDAPLRGSVGLAAEDGCKMVLRTADVMGNLCTEGGAEVKTTCDVEAVQAEATDLQDGSYQLHWRSKLSGTFTVKVLVDKDQVKGSPLKIKLTSTIPEVSRCAMAGDGLKQAVAGQPASISILFFDSYGNTASPGPDCKVGLGLTHDKKKITDVSNHAFEGGWGEEDSGEYNITYIAREAGSHELHVWCDPTNKGERNPLPGSPFHVHVGAGAPTASMSCVEGFTKESRQADRSGGKAHKQQSSGDASAAGSSMIIAGDQVSVKPLVIDEFGNPTRLDDTTKLSASVVKPDGETTELQLLTSHVKTSSLPQYEIKSDTHLAGRHYMHVLLNGEPLTGSPITFDVHASAPDPQYSRLIPPGENDLFFADYDQPSTVVLKTYDRFGNACTQGGLVPNGRLTLIKQASGDNQILMNSNHYVTAEDLHDGTYGIKIGIKIVATVRVFVNMDKNLPANGGELPSLQLTFVMPRVVTPEPAPAEAVLPAIAGSDASPLGGNVRPPASATFAKGAALPGKTFEGASFSRRHSSPAATRIALDGMELAGGPLAGLSISDGEADADGVDESELDVADASAPAPEVAAPAEYEAAPAADEAAPTPAEEAAHEAVAAAAVEVKRWGADEE